MFLHNGLKKTIFTFIFVFTFSNCIASESFLSLKKEKVNVRYGPSFGSPVKFIYKKIHLPVKQIDQKDNWRRIIDFKNNSGWIHRSQLKKVNSIILYKDEILFKKPTKFSKPIAKIKMGRVLLLEKCLENWCKIRTNKYLGWIEIKNFWGSMN
tara:strand:- start:121 stop:579 length:459 start_codon:yes stop_codon:yes gene_type:complete